MWRDYPCDLLLFCAMTEAPPNPLPLCRRSICRLLAQHSGSAPPGRSRTGHSLWDDDDEDDDDDDDATVHRAADVRGATSNVS